MDIYVGNLSYDMTNDELRAEFERYGTVDRARIITDRDTGRSKGFGFVEMPSSADASRAIGALNDSTLLGRKIRVNVAQGRNGPGSRRG